MLEIENPIVRGILGRSKPNHLNMVNHTGALALIRAGAKLTQHRHESGTGLNEYWMTLEDDGGTLLFKYSGPKRLISGERQKKVDEVVCAWSKAASPAERAAFKKLMHGGDDTATARYLQERTNLPMAELVIYIADIWEQEMIRVLGEEGPD